MPTNFKVVNGGYASDFSDLFIKKDLFTTGGLWAWGSGTLGQLGDNTIVSKSSPVQTIAGGTNWKQVACGSSNSIAIKTDGTLWTWGFNFSGQLGDNSTADKSSPVQTVAGGTNWKQVSAISSNVSAIKTDGTLWLWGNGTGGQLGDNTIVSKSSPVQTVAGGTDWKQVSSGSTHVAAVKTNGTLWLWGTNTAGALGDFTSVTKSSPVQTVTGGADWKQVSAGYTNGFTAAVKTDGTLWVWGDNTYGQLGINTTTRISSPVQTVTGGTNWKQVVAGGAATAGIKTDGTLWLWGINGDGGLGDNTSTHKSSPVQTVSGGTNWKVISLVTGAAAIKTDGTLWTWGWNASGQLGDNTVTRKSSPVQTVAGGTNWKYVYGTQTQTYAIRDDNTFKTT